MDGPVESIPFPNLCFTSVRIVPYVCFLNHLTNQGLYSFNYFIDPYIRSVKYSNRDDALLMIQLLGHGSLPTETECISFATYISQ